jgi:hypothetical protein
MRDFIEAQEGEDCLLVGEAVVDGGELIYVLPHCWFSSLNHGRLMAVRAGGEEIPVRAGPLVRAEGVERLVFGAGQRVAVIGRRGSEPVDGEMTYRRMASRPVLLPDASGEMRMWLVKKGPGPTTAETPRPSRDGVILLAGLVWAGFWLALHWLHVIG